MKLAAEIRDKLIDVALWVPFPPRHDDRARPGKVIRTVLPEPHETTRAV